MTVHGPDGQAVMVGQRGDADGYTVITRAEGVERVNRADTLADALRTSAKGVRALVKIAEQEAAIRKARQEALAALGEPESEEVAVEPDEVEPDENPALTWDADAPHSRACGIRQHDHGPACHPNCPSCNGKPNPEETR